MGNPTLGEVKTIMVGVRNNGRTVKSVEVWANELRLQEFSNEGGWAAQGNMNVQLSDIGNVNVAAQMETAGFGATWAAPIASLLTEKYLNGEISPKRKYLEERMLNSNLLKVEE